VGRMPVEAFCRYALISSLVLGLWSVAGMGWIRGKITEGAEGF
jgi:hypothetical protein